MNAVEIVRQEAEAHQRGETRPLDDTLENYPEALLVAAGLAEALEVAACKCYGSVVCVLHDPDETARLIGGGVWTDDDTCIKWSAVLAALVRFKGLASKLGGKA